MSHELFNELYFGNEQQELRSAAKASIHSLGTPWGPGSIHWDPMGVGIDSLGTRGDPRPGDNFRSGPTVTCDLLRQPFTKLMGFGTNIRLRSTPLDTTWRKIVDKTYKS